MEELTSWTDSDRRCLSKSAQSVDFSNDGPKNKTIGYWLEYLCQLSLDGLDERSRLLNIKNETYNTIKLNLNSFCYPTPVFSKIFFNFFFGLFA